MKSNSSSGIALVVVILVLILGGAVIFWWHAPTALAPAGTGTATTSTQVTYENPTLHYAITYPNNFSINTGYSYSALGPGQTISGVSLTIPPAMSAGTNLSSDSYISVESIATSTCSASIFLGDQVSTSTQNILVNGISYNVAQGGDAGAGNFYEEHVFAVVGSNPCIAVRYFIHSSNIDNYTTGTVQEFNHDNLIAAFDGIRETLVLNK